jgi:hypothetical protein
MNEVFRNQFVGDIGTVFGKDLSDQFILLGEHHRCGGVPDVQQFLFILQQAACPDKYNQNDNNRDSCGNEESDYAYFSFIHGAYHLCLIYNTKHRIYIKSVPG